MDIRLIKNIVLSIGYNILTIIVPFITAPYLGRVLGAEQVGTYTYFQSIGSYFVMFGILGMRNYGNRMIARVRDSRKECSKVFFEIYSMQLFTGFLMSVFYAIYSLNWSSNKLIAILIVPYVMTAFISVDWFCEGMEEFSVLAKRTVAIKFINLLLIFVFVRGEQDLIPYCLIMSGGYFVSALLLWPSVIKSVDYIRPNIKQVVSHFKENLSLFIPAIAASIYQTMDKIMIGAISSEAQLAYYEYADKIIQIPNLIFTAMGAVMLSRMSHVFHNDFQNAERTIGLSMELSFIISTVCGFGIFAVAQELVAVYYGENFLQSAPILLALCPTIMLYGWANVIRMQYIIPNSMDRVYIKSTIIGAIVNLICNMIFISQYQAIGATIGTIAAQFSVAAVFTTAVWKRLPLKKYFIASIPLWGIGLIMFLIIKLVQQFHDANLQGLITDVFIGGIVYTALAIVYGLRVKNSLAGKVVELFTNRLHGKRTD